MKHMYIDCSMGAAGDMLTGALLELMPDRSGAANELNAMGIPGIRYEVSDSEKCGVTGTHVSVTYNGIEEVTEDVHEHEHEHKHEHAHEHRHDHHDEHEEHEHHHSHEHDHNHDHDYHAHRGLKEVGMIIDRMILPAAVKEDIRAVYQIIAEAESHAHETTVDRVHFHEVGQMDAIADVAAVCLLMNKLAPDAVSVSDIHLGCGRVRCAHGIMDVPTPATAYIVADLPTYSDGLRGELCTPTGAALLKYYGREFGGRFEDLIQNASERIAEYPEGTAPSALGRGMGRKDFERPNCVTIFIK